MSSSGTVVVRRTWPQRLVILGCVGVIAGAIGAAWFLNDVYQAVSRLGRVEFAADVLITDTEPGEPVNFLLIGEDSALGLDPDDPVAIGREYDPRGTFHADSISILRVNPTTGQAWVLSVPRDLLVEHQGGERQINAVLLVSGHNELVETITDNFGIPINHYMSLDFLGFREVVDELDGVPVWFEHEARDVDQSGRPRSGLSITTPGCHVLNGEQALQYVRSRHYQELIDGEWEYVGNSDFGRVERQQDFLVLAMERAIDRGARNPSNLASLITAGAESIVLDDQLTVAELVDVGEAFSDFNPENLERFELSVSTIFDDVSGNYLGERPNPGVNDEVFGIFRGGADLRGPSEVAFDLYGTDDSETVRIAAELEGEGFTVSRLLDVGEVEDDNVVSYPTGERSAAETVARYLEPIPRLVEDPDASAISVVLGTDHEQVLIFFPHEVPKMRAAVGALGDGPVPTLDTAVELGPPSSTFAAPVTTESVEATTTTLVSVTTTSTVAPSVDPVTPVPTAGVIGRPPEGQSCG
jgi:LCP family protein required for cell wall assembly